MTVTVLNHLWQSSLFALAVWILAFLFRNNGASVRHGLWLAASVKFLLPFSLLAAIGRMSFAHSVAPGSMQALVRIAPAAMPFNTVPALAVSAPQQLSWPAIAAAIWGVGFLAIVLFWLARAMRLERIVRAAAPLDIDAPIPVRATAELLEPGLAGIFRPVILVPESLMQKLSRTEVDTILAHELCHLRRRDNLAALVHMLVEAVFWFHPLVWFIGARLVEEREQACDEGVLDDGKQPLDYAHAILKVCRLYFRSPLPCASGVSGADLDRRITAIMMRRDADDVDPNKILLLAGLGLFALMTPFVLGGLKPASPAPLMQSLVRMFAPGEPAIAPALSAAPSSRPHQSHHASAQIVAVPAQQRLVAAPAIDAGIPIIIVPTPELPQSPPLKEESVASDTEELVCRPPQQLRDSRLPGPRVCLPKREWDRMAAQDLQLMPDGRTVAGGFEREHTLDGRVCRMVAVNTGTAAATLNFSCF